MRKEQRKKQLRRKLAIVCTCSLAGFVAIFGGISLKWEYDQRQEEKLRIEREEAQKKQEEEERKAEEKRKLEERLNVKIDMNIYSKAAIVKDLKNQKVLASKSPEERIYPASMTKIMTALVAIEEFEDLDKSIVIPVDEVLALYERGASMAGFKPGESVSVRDLLYGLMLPSGADCCMALACEIAGDEAGFVQKMNAKAKELGMTNTNFVNASGLHDENHYSTVQDILVLLEYALKNETFYQVFTTRSYTTAPTQEYPEGITFESTMYEKKDSLEVTDGEILGGKTGFTSAAGLCLASLAEVEGQEYILVTAGAEGNHDTEPFHILDAENIYSQIGAAIVGE